MSTAERARAVIQPIAVSLGYEIVDVEYVFRDGDQHLICYIDCPGGITLDDCERFSHAIDDPLDQADPTDGRPYLLDVSSPGLDREFVTQRDFERNFGREVEARLRIHIQGRDLLVGVLTHRDDTHTVLQVADQSITVANTDIFFVRPFVKFG